MNWRVRYGRPAGAAALASALLLAGCGGRDGGPAPVVMGGQDSGAFYAPPAPRDSLPPPRPLAAAPVRPIVRGETQRITVARGQSLSVIAHTYHVPQRLIIEANHLQPPDYKVKIGSTLLIPGGSFPVAAAATHETLAPPSRVAESTPPPRNAATVRPEKLPVAGAHPAAPTHGPAAEVAADIAQDAAAEKSAASGHKPVAPRIAMAPAVHPTEKSAPEAAHEPGAAPHAGSFMWPVRGHVLAAYGTGADGTHNDGINIAAPKGAAVEASDAGVVAYAGNELRGYGNLILIKHPGGWISAYAHCDEILVKRGQKVARGQTIARVGETGSVQQPQLHFELRRGDHPVDPRGLLAPSPSAAAGRGAHPAPAVPAPANGGGEGRG